MGRTPSQNLDVHNYIAELQARGATEFRIDQQQINFLRDRVGINRPDLQYTFEGQRYYVEWDRVSSLRGPGHAGRIKANDTDFGGIELRTIG